ASAPHLKRVLGLWDLIYYGVILTSPIAAVPLFGEAQVLSHGHAVATLLLAMVAMSVTAVSFGRMASVYPSSGSVYTYISKGLNPHVGFIVIVTFAFIVEAFRYIILHQHFSGLISLQPIYNPDTFKFRAVASGTGLAALVFIGFDGVSILAEEVKNPRRNVLLASVLVCVFTGLFSGFQVYMAQRVWPDYTTLQNPETAFMDVARVASGPWLFTAYGIMLLVSSIACGLAGHVGASRLLYSMGRDDVLPKKIFGYISPSKGNP